MKVLISRKNLKDACRIVKQQRLREEFPDIEQHYQELVLERLMNTQAWPAAVDVVKDNKILQASEPPFFRAMSLWHIMRMIRSLEHVVTN